VPAQDRRSLGEHGNAWRLACPLPLAFPSRPVDLHLRPCGARFGPEQGSFAPVEALPGGHQPGAGALDGLLRTPVPVRNEHGKVTDQFIKVLLVLIGQPLALVRLLLAHIGQPVALVRLAFAPVRSGGTCLR
jgi:hypothetical protein